jgi:EpsD family peptidyl-prolyl cis-trans isomerase
VTHPARPGGRTPRRIAKLGFIFGAARAPGRSVFSVRAGVAQGAISGQPRRIALLDVSGLTGSRWRLAGAALGLAAAVALAGCGKKEDAPAVVGQVVAHVGPDDITQQEIDNELNLASVPQDKRTDEVVKLALSRIIQRKYLVQQAMAAKLDREPTAHLDLLRAREQILANAYVRRDIGSKVGAISQTEIDAYIQAHPDKFAKRQLYQIEQVTFPPQQNMEALAAATKDFKTMDQVEAKLNELGIKYSRGPATLDTAAIPAEMLKPLEARKPDDVFFLRGRTSASYFKVVSVDEKPLTGQEANEFAKRELISDLGRKTAQDTFTAALAAAKYEGDYNRIMTASPPVAPPPVEAPAGEAQSGEKPAGEQQSGTKPAEPQKDAPKN